MQLWASLQHIDCCKKSHAGQKKPDPGNLAVPHCQLRAAWGVCDLSINATADPKGTAVGGFQVPALLTAEWQVVFLKGNLSPAQPWQPQLLNALEGAEM